MITDSKITGVIFTRDQNNGLPFTTVNFTLGKKLDLITSGKQNGYVFRYLNTFEPKFKKFNLDKIHKFITKLKSSLRFKNLDIEFSISKSGRINLFQVRKLNFNDLLSESRVIASYKSLEKNSLKLLKIIFFKRKIYNLFNND